jgi:hypothetical protein
MRSTPAPLPYVSNAGASAPSMPAGNSAGAISPIAGDAGRRFVETYCYAFAGTNFLEDEPQQPYWRTDIVQMTCYYMIEAADSGIRSRPAAPDSRCKSVPTAARQDAIGIFLISVTLRSQGPVVLNARLSLQGHR